MLELTGTVCNGSVVLDDGATLPEGSKVTVTVEASVPDVAEPTPAIWSSLLELAGTIHDLPEDASEQHDHYLYGTPKR